jgi:hypothetical protein
MTSDPITDALERLAPARPFLADWDDVERRAGTRRWTSPRKRWVLAAALAAAILIPIGALGASGDWWFFAAHAPEPVTTPGVVKSGVWNGQRWELIAYGSATHGLCFSMGPAGSLRTNGAGAAMNCGGFDPDAKLDAGEGVPHGITYLSGAAPQLPRYVVGPVVEAAVEVVISFGNGDVVRTPTFAAPPSLGAVRFYATQVPDSVPPATGIGLLEKLVGLDRSGRVVACLAVPSMSAAAC